MVSVANNVVALVKGAHAAAGKHSGTKSNSDASGRGSSDTQVTVLFPRGKMNAGNWPKTQKAAANKASDTPEADDSSDQNSTQDMFGSLVASVEQKLMQQDGQSAVAQGETTTDVTVDTTTLRGSRFMSLGVMPESVQLMARGVGDDVGKVASLTARVPENETEPQPMADTPETKIVSNLPVLDAKVAQGAGTELNTQTSVDTDMPTATSAIEAKAVPQASIVQSKVVSEIPVVQVKPSKVSTPGQTDAKRSPDRIVSKTDTPSLAEKDLTPVLPAAAGSKVEQSGEDAGTVLDPTNSQTSAFGSEVKSKADGKPALAPVKGDEPRRVEAKAVAASDSAPVSSVSMSDGKLLSPAAQIVENIKNAVPAAAASTPEYVTAAPQMVKTLEIQLQPEGLGPVTVSLKSEQGKLKVQISAKLDTTRQELERSAVELIGGLQAVDPTFTQNDVNFSNQNQGAAADTSGQAFSNGNERRGTPENMPGFGSNGGQDANQSSAQTRNAGPDRLRPGQAAVAGDQPAPLVRADGIYL